MKIRLSLSLAVAGLLAFALLMGCGESPDRVVSPDASNALINSGLATGLDQPVVGDETTGGDTSVEDDYVDDGTTDFGLPDDDEDEPLVDEDTAQELL